MKDSTKDRVEGKLHQLKGKAKEVAGVITDDRELEVEGKAEKVQGKIQEKVGQVETVLDK